MALNLDSYLGVHAQALTLEAQRTQVLAANLANADTPNYKARDIDFAAALAAAGGAAAAALPLAAPAAGQIAGAAAAGVAGAVGADVAIGSYLKYRTPMAPSLDGNTVDTQLEQAAFAENSVRYETSLTLLNVRLRELMTAIVGQ